MTIERVIKNRDIKLYPVIEKIKKENIMKFKQFKEIMQTHVYNLLNQHSKLFII